MPNPLPSTAALMDLLRLNVADHHIGEHAPPRLHHYGGN
jgi:hypothetical protein